MVKDRLIHHSYDPYLGRKLLPRLSHIIFEDMKTISRKYTKIKLYHYPLIKSNLIPPLTKMFIACQWSLTENLPYVAEGWVRFPSIQTYSQTVVRGLVGSNKMNKGSNRQVKQFPTAQGKKIYFDKAWFVSFCFFLVCQPRNRSALPIWESP